MHSFFACITPLTLLAVLVLCECQNTVALEIDLSKDYEQNPTFNETLRTDLTQLAADRQDVIGFLAIDNGMVIAEQYDSGYNKYSQFTLWSGTKSWTGLIMGAMEHQGILRVDETLWDIWPNQTIWDKVDDGEERKKITIELLLQMRAGFKMPPDYAIADTIPIGGGKLGGQDFLDALTYHTLRPNKVGEYFYLPANNLVSYIILERSGLTPEQYALEYIFPRLGIMSQDYQWAANTEGVTLGFHGLSMTTRAYSKLGMLYLQNGKTSANDTEGLVSPSWIQRTFTVGDEESSVSFGYLFWIESDTVFCSKGLGGQRMCLNTKSNRAIVVAGKNYDEKLAEFIEGEDAYPQNQLVDMFLGVSPTNKETPFDVLLGPSGTSQTGDVKILVALGILMVVCVLMI